MRITASVTISAIFRDNVNLCSRVSPKLVRLFITAIEVNGCHPNYLMPLRSILAPNNQSLPNNQRLVLNLLVTSEKVTKKEFFLCFIFLDIDMIYIYIHIH